MPDDTAISHRIREALSKDERTSSLEIHVRTVEGIVFLDGEVEPEADRAAIHEVASKVEGVHYVKDRLHLKARSTAHERPEGRDYR